MTKKDLSTIKDELGAFSTDAGGGERWQNLKTGVDLLNGSVLMPGEQYPSMTGPRLMMKSTDTCRPDPTRMAR